MQEVYDEFQRRGVAVIAVAQEDADLKSHGRIIGKIEPAPRFEIVADLNREQTQAYDRTTAYFVEKSGRVRQIFPMLIRFRPSWQAVLNEIDRIMKP